MFLYLVRHTKVDVKPGVCYGAADVGLAKTFEDEKEKVSERLLNIKPDKIFSSPLSRCRILAESLYEKEIIYDEALKELNFGEWEGSKWEIISKSSYAEKWFNDYINIPCPGGESYKNLLDRVEKLIIEKLRDLDEVVVFTHGGVIRAFYSLVKNVSPEKAFDLKIDYGQVVKLKL